MRLLAVAWLLVGVPVSAQRATETDLGSHIPVPMRARIPESGSLPEIARGRLVMAQFARCVVDREYLGVNRAVATSSDSVFDAQVRRLATPDCLDSGMISFKPSAIRGPLYKELYVRRSDAAARGRSWGPTAEKIDLGKVANDDANNGRAATLAFGDCVIRRNEAGARRIVLAPTASVAQDQAVQAIVPDLSACLTQESQLRMGKAFVEAILAEVLYRGVTAPTAVTTAVAESK